MRRLMRRRPRSSVLHEDGYDKSGSDFMTDVSNKGSSHSEQLHRTVIRKTRNKPNDLLEKL